MGEAYMFLTTDAKYCIKVSQITVIWRSEEAVKPEESALNNGSTACLRVERTFRAGAGAGCRLGACPRVQGRAMWPPAEAIPALLWDGSARRREWCGAGAFAG